MMIITLKIAKCSSLAMKIGLIVKISGNRILSVRTFQHKGLAELESFPHLMKDLRHLDNNQHDIIRSRDGCRNISFYIALPVFLLLITPILLGVFMKE